jgi:predicted ATPase
VSKRTIDRIVVEGYKSIKQCNLELGSLNVLIGPNGAGKSNFVSLFSLLGSIVNNQLATTVGKSGGASKILHHGPKQTKNVLIHAYFGINQYQARLVPATSDTFVFESETCLIHDEAKFISPLVKKLGAGGRESSLSDAAKDPSPNVYSHCRDAMLNWRVFHFHDTSSTAGVKQNQPIGDNRFLRSDASNLAPFLRRLRSVELNSFNRLLDQIRLVAPFFRDFVLEPDGMNESQMKLEWRHRSSDAYFDAHSLSDGTLRFICLATLLLQPKPPSVIVVDEPELGLHPFAITQLAEILRSVSSQTQLIVSTQSVSLLNQLDLENVIVTEQVNGESTFHRPSLESLERWLEEYSVGELWEKNLLGGRPQ